MTDLDSVLTDTDIWRRRDAIRLRRLASEHRTKVRTVRAWLVRHGWTFAHRPGIGSVIVSGPCLECGAVMDRAVLEPDGKCEACECRERPWLPEYRREMEAYMERRAERERAVHARMRAKREFIEGRPYPLEWMHVA